MSQLPESIYGNVVDLVARQIFPGRLILRDGRIVDVQTTDQQETTRFLLPGFVDAHIHIESSMLLPSQFAQTAVLHGTVATVSDPHEIANVCGTAGINLMLRDAGQSPFKFFFRRRRACRRQILKPPVLGWTPVRWLRCWMIRGSDT